MCAHIMNMHSVIKQLASDDRDVMEAKGADGEGDDGTAGDALYALDLNGVPSAGLTSVGEALQEFINMLSMLNIYYRSEQPLAFLIEIQNEVLYIGMTTCFFGRDSE